MKKLRSQLPRRKRTTYSPVIRSSVHFKHISTTNNDSASNITSDVTVSYNSSPRASTNNKSVKKRSFTDRNGANEVVNEFRRITRSYSKQLDIISKNIIRKDINEQNDVVCDIESSDVTTRSECSVFTKVLTDGGGTDKLHVNEVNDVVSEVTTRSECSVYKKVNEEENDVVSVYSKPKFELTDAAINEVNEEENDVVSVYFKPKFELTDVVINEGESVASGVDIGSCINNNNSVTNETVNDDEVENCGESKLISVDFDLTCSERLSSRYEECESSSAEYTDANMESSEFEVSSEFDTSTWYDSGSQFSERSVGDTTPSPTFQLFQLYRQKFCKSEFGLKVSSEHIDSQPCNRIIKLLRAEDEEHEESYQMLKKRERRQVYLHDYAAEYSGMKEYGDVVVHQRSKMVHWIMKQSAYKELQEKTMFLGVNLLDRFLSKGYLKNKRELEIAGIACLTLATRIEENQPYNSIRQKIFNIGGNEYSRSEVVAMEWLVQDVLNFKCYLPTIYNFLWFYLKAARGGQGVAKTAKHLAVHALLGHEQLSYWPSTVAASLVCLACLTENKQSSHQQITRIRNGSNDTDLPDCIKSMEYLVQSIRYYGSE